MEVILQKYRPSVILLLLFVHGSLHVNSVSAVEKYPNIVLIVANELGLEDLNHYREHVKHINRLARDGISFGHVYSNLYPTSSRAALLTGRLPVKSGMLKGRFLPFISFPSIASSGGMPLNEITLAEALKIQGYVSKFVGLWDLGLGKDGKFLPLNQGFQSWFGVVSRHTKGCSTLPQGSAKRLFEEVLFFLCKLFSCLFGAVSLWYFRYLKPKFLLFFFMLFVVLYAMSQGFHGITFINVRSCVLFRDNSIIAQPYDVENITLRFTEEAMNFINQAASSSRQPPFFLAVNHLVFSKPIFSSQISKNFSGEDNKFLDSLMELDWSVGDIVGTIGRLNLTDDTVVIFTSLSGLNHVNVSVGDSSLTSEKEEPVDESSKVRDTSEPDNWESCITVPLYIKWVKNWKGGMIINSTVTLMDIMPTVLELTNQTYSNETVDGKSLLPLLNKNSSSSMHKFVFHYLDVTRPSAITYGKYKAFYHTITGDKGNIYHDPPILYDIEEDPHESSPLLADEFKDVISNISAAVDKHVENRTRKWISQFEHPIYPWLFPCVNFPYCYKTDVYKLNRIFHSVVLD